MPMPFGGDSGRAALQMSRYSRSGRRTKRRARLSFGLLHPRRWFVRKDIAVRRLVLMAALATACLGLAWSVIAETAAFNLAESDPLMALAWRAHAPAALDEVAERELSKGKEAKLDTARASAQAALAAAPLDERALAVLGGIAEREGDQQRAELLMRMAGARTGRDRGVQAWLFDHEVRRHDYAQALPYADAILRVEPALQSQLLPVLAAFTVEPAAFAALTDFLAAEPPWRPWLLSELSRRLANRARLTALYDALKATPAPPSNAELQPYLARLVGDGAFALARATWRQTLPKAMRRDDVLLFNGDFALPIDGMPFNWVLTPIDGADIAIVPSPSDPPQNALQVEFSGGRVNFANVRQLLMLKPGAYRLSGMMRSEQLDNPRGLRWRIFCAGGGEADLGQTQSISGTVGWTDLSTGLQVPESGCAAQWIQLELPARIASEMKIGGVVWYRGMTISPATAGAGPADPLQKDGKRS